MDFPETSMFLNSLNPSQKYEMFEVFFSYLNMPWEEKEEELKVQDLKYLFLGLYFTEAFFTVYDRNHDRILDLRELEPLSCFISYFVPIICPAREHEQTKISRYLINEQTLPSERKRYISKIPTLEEVWYTMFVDDELEEPLSFLEVSRLSHFILEATMKGLKAVGEEKKEDKENKCKKKPNVRVKIKIQEEEFIEEFE